MDYVIQQKEEQQVGSFGLENIQKQKTFLNQFVQNIYYNKDLK